MARTTTPEPGYFITFEGGEACGKSTQLALLAEALCAQKIPCVTTREPGGTPLAESIRTLTLSPDHAGIAPLTEYLLFSAARADHLRQKVGPALKDGTWVLCDRFYDSSMVYQHWVQGLETPFMDLVYRNVAAGQIPRLLPDLTIILDVPPALSLERARKRAAVQPDQHNRFEEMDQSFHQKVWEGFRWVAEQNPERCALVDGTADVQSIHQQIRQVVQQKLQRG